MREVRVQISGGTPKDSYRDPIINKRYYGQGSTPSFRIKLRYKYEKIDKRNKNVFYNRLGGNINIGNGIDTYTNYNVGISIFFVVCFISFYHLYDYFRNDNVTFF